MTLALEAALTKLTEIQREAAAHTEGALLLLAGPGSGKTQVLTTRIAQLLENSRGKNFRVLGLTFTTKAADEMKQRVASFVPDLEQRANIGTFHSFCGQMLRQHGVHLGINPDFAIYSRDEDRKSLLGDALREAAKSSAAVSNTFVDFLPLIDRLKARLVEPNDAVAALREYESRDAAAITYRLYEDELRRSNAMDFNGLILEAFRLATKFPLLAGRYRVSHPYWLIDEFQDTNLAQYRLIHALAGDFRNVFAVADDDQIIYQWNGASYRRIQSFIQDFGAATLQLPTNYRCPPIVVQAANQLVAYNALRTASKRPLEAGKTLMQYPEAEQLQLRKFDSEEAEATSIATEIAALGKTSWGAVAVLARTRALLERMQKSLTATGVPSVIAQRRDDFLAPEFRWLAAALHQVARPLDRRNFGTLCGSFDRMVGTKTSSDQIISEAEASNITLMAHWMALISQLSIREEYKRAIAALNTLPTNAAGVRAAADDIIKQLQVVDRKAEADSDFGEDSKAWRELTADIAMHVGRDGSLDEFLQELQMRSKEPMPRPDTVTLTTVHAAKGREFDTVYVIGLAEDVMPSFQSKQKGANSPEMEEERRNCFVAITRAKERLILSCAGRYRGYSKSPSRFLAEMGLAVPT